MIKNTQIDFTKSKGFTRLNNVSKLYVKQIYEEILSLNAFDCKIYPQGSKHSHIDYRIIAKKLAKLWVDKWLEIFQCHIVSVVYDLMPQIKQQIIDEKLKDNIDDLITSTVETEYFSMFKKIVEKYFNEVQIYKLIDKLEQCVSYLSKGYKVESNINIYPIDLDLIMGCVYKVCMLDDQNFKIELYVQSKCLKFKNVTQDKEIQNEIKEKVKEFINKK